MSQVYYCPNYSRSLTREITLISLYGRDFVVINHAFFSLEVSGHAAVFFSPMTMYPRGIMKRLQTVSFEPGVLTLQALAGCRGSLLREQAGEDSSPVTTYPVGIRAASTSLPFHIRKPLQMVSLERGFLMNQALVSSRARVLAGQFASNPSFTTA